MSSPTTIETIVVDTDTQQDVSTLTEPLLVVSSSNPPHTTRGRNTTIVTTTTSTGPETQRGRCMLKACCCSYVALDCNNIVCGCKGEQDILCIRHACCLSLNGEPRACGCSASSESDPDKICNAGCLCCDLACVRPKTCISGATSVCCLYQVASFPFSKHYVDQCVCAFCFWSCAPTCGCCVAPPKCPALNKHTTRDVVRTITMDRGVDQQEVSVRIDSGRAP